MASRKKPASTDTKPTQAAAKTRKRARSSDVPATKRPGPRAVTTEHRQALNSGRLETRIVREYLEALEAHKPKRGPKKNPERLRQRIAALDDAIATADPLTRINLMQERTNLVEELAALETVVDLQALEDEAIKVLASYSQRRGISAATWQAGGVKADVLRRAGIK